MKYKIKYPLIVCAMLTAALSGCADAPPVNEEPIEQEPIVVTEQADHELTEEEIVIAEDVQESEEVEEVEELDELQTEVDVQSQNTATEEPVMTPAPEQEPTAKTTASDGGIPFHLSRGTNLWWSIDSTDAVYWAVQNQINAMRAEGGLSPLTMDDGLSSIAYSRCESFMGGPFDHSGMVTSGEILACGSWGTASGVCSAWKNSPDHYAAIMNSTYTRMGVGCWFLDDGNQQYTYWAVTFE